MFYLGLQWQHPLRAHIPGFLHFYPSYLLRLWASSSGSPGFSDPYCRVRDLEEVLGSEVNKQGSCSTRKRGFSAVNSIAALVSPWSAEKRSCTPADTRHSCPRSVLHLACVVMPRVGCLWIHNGISLWENSGHMPATKEPRGWHMGLYQHWSVRNGWAARIVTLYPPRFLNQCSDNEINLSCRVSYY